MVDYNTRISTVTVVKVEVNGKDHLGVTLTIGGGSIELTLPNTIEVKRLIEEAKELEKTPRILSSTKRGRKESLEL